MNGIKELFANGDNIVSTHALFSKFSDEILDMAYFNHYTLVMDEVADVVEQMGISKDDLDTILKNYAIIKEDGMLEWTAPNYVGKFEEYKSMIEMESVTVHRTQDGDNIAFLWFFPVKVFQSFKEVYILTYMFDGQIQKYYYDFYGVDFKYLYVKDMHLTEERQVYDDSKIKGLINVCKIDKLNQIGYLPTALSKSWFDRNKGNALMKQLRNNVSNYFRHIVNSPHSDTLWTTFKEHEPSLKGKGYGRSFVSLNIRATNDYIERKTIAYLANRYLNPIIVNFFRSRGVLINEDQFALSELIQFIFRGAIRKGEPINVYIPSKRMRDIMTNWINKKEE